MKTILTAPTLILTSCLLVSCVRRSKAFAPQTQAPFLHRTTPSSSSLHNVKIKTGGNDDSDHINEEAMERNKQRTCIKQFLTQRSIQSFMFLAEQVRDPHTADWIERLLGKTDLLNFHGTGAFDVDRFPTWDAFFKELIQQPKSSIIVQAKRRGRGHGGWSKNNPYLKVLH